MIHRFYWAVQGEFDAEGFIEKAKSLTIDQATFVTIMTQHTKLTKDQINDMFSIATYINAQEALNHAMVDEVRTVEIPKGALILPPN